MVVITGRDKGKTRRGAARAAQQDARLIVQGVNMWPSGTRGQRWAIPSGDRREGAADPHLQCRAYRSEIGKPTRVGFKIVEGGRKVRVARRSGEVID